MDRFPFIYRLARGLFRYIYFPLHGGMTTLHAERVPTEGGVILAPVHVSWLDPPAVSNAIWNRRCRALAKEELFENKLFGAIISGIGAFPVRRGEGDLEAVRKCIEILTNGEAIIVFPEGTRNNGETMLQLAQGTAMLAKKAGVPVVPIGIAGTQFLMPNDKTKPRVKRSHVTMVVGEPFRYEEVAKGANEKENRRLFLAELQRRMLALTAEAGVPLKPFPAPAAPAKAT